MADVSNETHYLVNLSVCPVVVDISVEVNGCRANRIGTTVFFFLISSIDFRMNEIF